jgi:hypothetical protein
MSSSDLPKLWTTSSKIAKFWLQSHFSASKIIRIFLIFFLWRIFDKETNFYKWNFLKTLIFKVLCFLKMCPIFVSYMFIILVGLTMTRYSEKMSLSNRCIRGLMPNLIKKSWRVSKLYIGWGRRKNILCTFIVLWDKIYLPKHWIWHGLQSHLEPIPTWYEDTLWHFPEVIFH